MLVSAAVKTFCTKNLNKLKIAWALAARDLAVRYARSGFGLFWLLITPVALLSVYWLVFGVALGITWPDAAGGTVGYIVPFMAGLTIYLFLAEVVTSSITLFVAKRNFVRKSALPLSVLWLANYLRCLVIASFNLIVLIALAIWFGLFRIDGVVWTAPILLSIMLAFGGLSLILAGLGSFIGDMANGAQVVLRVMFYGAPVTYPLALLPPDVRPWLWLNPLTTMVELFRDSIVFGQAPAFWAFVALSGGAVLAFAVASLFFARVSPAIPDVV